MSDEYVQEDQSHYEISLTGAQAFVAFVLLLLSLAASFAFGLMIGKGQADGRLIVQREPSVVTEANLASRPAGERIVELGVGEPAAGRTDSASPAADESTPAPVVIEEPQTTDVTASDFVSAEGPSPAAATPAPAAAAPAVSRPVEPHPTATAAKVPPVAHYAQLLSTGDQKTAEGLAARLIDNGFNSAYVERGSNEKGQIFRVRVKFGSEAEARAAEARLRTFSKEVWITK